MSIVISNRVFVGVIGQVSLVGSLHAVCGFVGTLSGVVGISGNIIAVSSLTGTMSNATSNSISGIIIATSALVGTLSDVSTDDILKGQIFDFDSMQFINPTFAETFI